MRRMMASPSKILLGSFSSRVRSTRAALRSLFSANCTRQSSRLLRRPYSPTILSSLSRRSFSNGRRGFLKVLESVEVARVGKPEVSDGVGESGGEKSADAAMPRAERACTADSRAGTTLESRQGRKHANRIGAMQPPSSRDDVLGSAARRRRRARARARRRRGNQTLGRCARRARDPRPTGRPRRADVWVAGSEHLQDR